LPPITTVGEQLVCIVCQAQQVAYRSSLQCGGCFARMRGDLATVADAYELLADGMSAIPPGWRTGTIHSASSEAPLPFRSDFHDLRVEISGTIHSWARTVAEKRTPPAAGPADSSLPTTVKWLRAQLPWCSTQQWVTDLAAELKDLRRQAHALVPWQAARTDLPTPCGGCGRLTLTQYAEDDGVICTNRACGGIYEWPQYVELVYAWCDRVTMEARRRRALDRPPTDDDRRLAVALDPGDLDNPAAIWLTTDQAAEAAHVDAGRIRGWASRGKIRPHYVDDTDDAPLYRLSDVLEAEASTRRGRRELTLLGEAFASINARAA
jgi:hypothetical protein